MMTIVYSGENTEKEASNLFAQASLMDAKEMMEIDSSSDVIGFVIRLKGGMLPSAIEQYIRAVLSKRDNSKTGYIFAIFLGDGRWASDDLTRLLSDQGCALSYYAYMREENKQTILDEINREEYKITGNGLFYRLFKRKIMTYED